MMSIIRITFSVCTILGFFLVSNAFALIHVEKQCPDDELEANCIANGGVKYILLTDYISQSDFEEIAYVAGQLPSHLAFPKVVINSHGGSLDAAIGIGRILRWRKATIETLDIAFQTPKSKCYSACVVLASGAVHRQLSMIGIHTGYLKTDAEGIDGYQPMPDASKARLRSYYNEMGISDELQNIEAKTPFWEMSYFYFNTELEPSVQKIVQWGFYMH